MNESSSHNTPDTADLLREYQRDKRAAQLYEALSSREGDHRMAFMLNKLGRTAADQANLIASRLSERGVVAPAKVRLGLREHLAIWLCGQFGVRPMRSVLTAMRIRGMSAYTAPHLRGHVPIEDLEQLQNTPGNSGNLRAAVFGVNDGLVSNTSLILGMVGAASDSRTVLIAGIAGMLAGAMSMAAGEFISVRSQREVYEYQIELERTELEEHPEAERRELAIIYEAKGLTAEEADRVARTLIADPERALDAMAREELGLNPDELGSPIGAALYSFVSFTAGALVPVFPFVFFAGDTAITTAVVLACFFLFLVGAMLSLFTGRGALRSGFRMLAIGLGAGLVTYGIGSLLSLTSIV